MRTVTKFVTFDGLEHPNKDAATKHLESLYANCLSRIAAKLVAIDKYVAMGEYIDANLHHFAMLQKIKNDKVWDNEEDE